MYASSTTSIFCDQFIPIHIIFSAFNFIIFTSPVRIELKVLSRSCDVVTVDSTGNSDPHNILAGVLA